jgi:hypothetical protein
MKEVRDRIHENIFRTLSARWGGDNALYTEQMGILCYLLDPDLSTAATTLPTQERR